MLLSVQPVKCQWQFLAADSAIVPTCDCVQPPLGHVRRCTCVHVLCAVHGMTVWPLEKTVSGGYFASLQDADGRARYLKKLSIIGGVDPYENCVR